MKKILLPAIVALVMVTAAVASASLLWLCCGYVYYNGSPVSGAAITAMHLEGETFTSATQADGSFIVSKYVVYPQGQYFFCAKSGNLWYHSSFTYSGSQVNLGQVVLHTGIHPRHPAPR